MQRWRLVSSFAIVFITLSFSLPLARNSTQLNCPGVEATPSTVILSGAKDLQFPPNENQLQILRSAQDDRLHTVPEDATVSGPIKQPVGRRKLHAGAYLPRIVNELMQGKQGAVIVSDPRTGRVLAVWNQQVAFHEAFPPGSTAKLVVSAAALEEGVVTPTEFILCRRVPRLLGASFHCSHPSAGEPFCLSAALANSCNYYFSELSSRLASSALAHWYAAFGFEVFTPTQESPRARALAALGAEGVRATPEQVLMAYSAVAEGGKVYHRIAPGENQPPRLERIVPLTKSTLAVLTQALRECVESGTGRRAAVSGVSVAGKTGTAATGDGGAVTHAWFAGYAPSGDPQVAVVVFLNRGTGGADAAPVAAEIFGAYFGHSGDTR